VSKAFVYDSKDLDSAGGLW